MPCQARRRVLIRADSGGGTHDFLAWLTQPGGRLAYTVPRPVPCSARSGSAAAIIPAKGRG